MRFVFLLGLILITIYFIKYEKDVMWMDMVGAVTFMLLAVMSIWLILRHDRR